MAKLPDKFSVGHPVILDSTNGHPVRPVDVNGVALDDSTTSFSVAHPVIETDANGVVLLDSTKSFSMVRKVRIDPKGTPIITIDTSGTALGTTLGIGGGTAGAPSYDTRWGTATDTSTGWITFTPHSGASITWLDNVNGLDTNSGASAALAVKTVDHAISVMKTNYVNGVQSILMIAGGAGQNYVTNGDTTGDLGTMQGLSKTYPILFQSYNPAAPADTTQYGRLTGASMPMIKLTAGTASGVYCFFNNTRGDGTGTSYAFNQGVGFDGQDAANIDFGFAGPHSGIGMQNFRLKQVMFSLECLTSAGPAPWDTNPVYSQDFHLSKGSGWGQWKTDGNKSAFYFHGLKGLIVEDMVVIHGGWRTSRTRSDTDASTGAAASTGEGHGTYYHPENDPGNIFRRITYADNAADGANYRGGLIANCIVSLNEPIAGQLGGFSFSYYDGINASTLYLEAPNGVLIKITDRLIVSGKDINSSTPRGGGFGNQNTVLGSFIDNVVAFDNPKKGSGNDIFYGPASNTANIDQYLTLSRVRTWNYASILESDSGTDTAHIHPTWTACITEELAPGTGNVQAVSGTFPGAITYAQLITAMGFASEAAMFNAMLYRPDLPWAQALISISFPAYGAVPTYALVSPPSMTGITPDQVYSTGGWTPSSISGLIGWYDVDQQTEANGALVSTLVDRSGHGNDFTASGAERPTMVTAGIGGKKSLAFDGLGNQFSNATGLMNGATAGAWFAVIKAANDPPTTHTGGVLNGFGTSGSDSHTPFSDGNIYEGFGTTVRKMVGNPTPSLASPALVGAISASGDYRFFVNDTGTPFFTTATNTVGFGTATREICHSPIAGVWWEGQLAELIILNAVPNSTDLANIKSYVNTKYGTSF